MKRRDFISASAVLALLAGSTSYAAPKKSTKKASGNSAKKSSAKPASAKPTSASRAVSEPEAPSQAETPRNAISLPDEPLAQWKTYDISSTVKINNPQGKVRLWLPLVQYRDTPWERSLDHHWQGNFETSGIYRDPVADMEVFYADWPEGVTDPRLQIVSRISTQDRHFDITRRGVIAERTEILRRCLRSTELVPNDNIVRHTAERAIGRIKDPLAQGKAIYDWVVEHTTYDPQIKNTGHIHIGQLLESRNLTGRSAEISLLFVALCRSVGIPARPVFGLRMDSSRLFASLGASGNLSTAQHCRAEFYSPGYGWIPVNPSDVRKAIQGERLSSGDPKLTVLRKLLFGFWEMNWVGFNTAQDIVLRGSSRTPLPFLISPVMETREGRFGALDSERFSYSVTAQRTEI